MEYKRIEDKIVFRLEMGDFLMESAQKIAVAENIKLASINGIGACSKIEMGYIDLNIKEYIFKTFEGNLEILHATGNITLKDGEPFPHIHISVACHLESFTDPTACNYDARIHFVAIHFLKHLRVI